MPTLAQQSALANAAGLALLLAIGLVIAVLVCSWLVAWRLTRPPRRTYAWSVARGLPGEPKELDDPLPFESWALRSGAHALPAWTITGRDPRGPVAICAHGWGDSRVGALARVPTLAAACAQVLAFDMPGQGEARGRCALGTREHEHLRAAIGTVEPGRDVVLVGWSLGGGSCLRLAAELGDAPDDARPRILGVIVEAPYRLPMTPARNVLRLSGLPHRAPLPIAMGALNLCLRGELSTRRFDRAAWAARVDAPVLVLHGSDDEVCPIEDGRAIAEAAPRGRLREIRGGRHNDLWTDPSLLEQSRGAVLEFLRSLERGD